jgi:hypothetical protein
MNPLIPAMIVLSPIPANPKKYAWVSAVETGPYHIETTASAGQGGDSFKAICGAFGDFNCHLLAGQIFPSQKCKTCVEISGASTGNILDVQPTYHTSRGGNSNGLHVAQGAAPESDRHSAISELDGAQKRNGCVAQMDMPRNDAPPADESSASAATQVSDVADKATGNASVTDGLQVGDEGVGGSTEGRADEHKSDGQGEGEGRSNRVNDSKVTVRQTGRDCDYAKDLQLPNPKHYQLQVPTSGYQGPFADSQTFIFSIDHFTDNITRYVDQVLGRETELAEVGQ